MTTPDQLLSDAGWRRRHSVYALWALFLCGFVSLLYTGIRSHRRDWIGWGIVSGVVVVASVSILSALAPESPDENYSLGANLAGATMTAAWLVSGIHVFVARKDWLRWKAANQERPWHQPSTPAAAATAAPDLRSLGLEDPAEDYLAPPPSWPQPTPPSNDPRPAAAAPPPASQPTPAPPAPAQHAPLTLVDLNTATLEEIAELPGVGIATANRILEERTRRGGFATVDEAAVAANVPPHVRSRLPRTAIVSSRREPPRRGPAGRVVDI